MENDDREPEEAAEPQRGNNKKPNTTSLERKQVISAILEGTIVEDGKRVLPNKMASEITAKIGKHQTTVIRIWRRQKLGSIEQLK